MEQREGIKKKEKKKSNALFDILNDIKVHKIGNLLDTEGSEHEKAYNNYIAMRFLSMNESLCPLINSISHLHDSFDKKEMYKLLIELIPTINTFDPFISQQNIKLEYENDVANYYECSANEAREYIKIMGLDWAEKIHKSFGGVL